MKQVLVHRFGGPEVLTIADVPKPVPQSGQVAVRVHSAIVCFPDVLFRSGRYPLKEGALPYVPCSEATGIVEAVGPDVTDIAVGQAVYLNVLLTSPINLSGYAQETVVVGASTVVPVSDAIDLGDAIGIGYYTLARSLLFKGGQTLPATLMQSGAAGSFASALIQLADLLGVRVIGTVGSDEKAAFAKRSGAAETINYKTDDVINSVLALTDGKGVDLVIDHIGGSGFIRLFDALAPYGEICVVNMEAGPSGKDLLDPFISHSKRWPAVRFFAGHGFDHEPDAFKMHAREIVALMAEAHLRPVIARTFCLSDIVEAHRLVESGSPLGRVVVRIGD